MITTPGRSTVGISFHPIPVGPVTIPCPVTARGSVIGELVEYNVKTGRGKAELNNNTSAAMLPFLEIAGYTYINLTLEPDANQRNAMPDFRQVEALIESCQTKETIDEEGLIEHVLSRINPPEGGKRDAIITHVRQWHCLWHSP